MAVTRPSRKSRSARSRFNAGLDSLEIRTLLSGIVAQSSNNMNPFQTTPDGSGGVYSTETNTQTFDHAYFDSQGVYHLDNIAINGLPLSVRITAIAYSASDNTLWGAGSDHVIYHFDTAGNTTVASFDPSTKSAQFVNDNESISTMTVAADGTLWFTTVGSGSSDEFPNSGQIGRINLQQGTFSLTPLPEGTVAQSIAIAPDGTAWTTGLLTDQTSANTLTTTSSVTQASWNGSTISINTFNVADATNLLSNPVVIPSSDGYPGDYGVWFASSVLQNDNLVQVFPDVAGQLDHVTVANGQVPVAQVNLPGGGTQTQVVATTASIPPGAQSSLIPQALSVDSSGTLWIAELDQTDIASSGNNAVNAVDSFDTTTGDFSRITTGQDEPFDVQASGSTVWVTMVPANIEGFANGDLSEIDTINTADAGNIGTIGVGFDATTNQAYTDAISMFASTDTGDFAYTIGYGNGTTFSSTITNDGSGAFTIPGNITYTAKGNYPLTLTITSASGDIITVYGTAVVTDPVTTIPLTAQGIVPAISGEKDVALAANVVGQTTLVVAQFTGASPPSSYTATINWGDGTSTSGTIVSTGTNQYDVELAAGQTKTYHSIATFTISVTITDGTQTASVTSTANIGAVPVVASQNLVIKPLLGPIALGTVATFTADPLSNASWFKVTIKWGDGTSSAGLVVRTAAGTYEVIGLHLYTKKGTYTLTTSITDTVDNEVALATGTIKVTSVL